VNNTLEVKVEILGPRAIGKTFVADQIRALIDTIQSATPGRNIKLTITETNPYTQKENL
jgi:hypothetical protein